jgi:TRAP-type C4-dicarboxylate transport system substrate-binding protein
MGSELLWRRLSEHDKKQIEEKAKKVILDFSKTIEKLPRLCEGFVEREKFERSETHPWSADPEFKKLILKNAPDVQGDCIRAEKGKWVK